MIGIMGDSHDHVDAMKKAVEFFNSKKVDLVVLTGDLISPFMVEHLKEIEADVVGVFGNNEGDKLTLNKNLREMDTELVDFLEMEFGGSQIAIYHGHDPSILDSIVKSCKYDIVLTGHTHTPEVTVDENTLVVNPGELCGYLSGIKTVALLDIDTLDAQIHDLSV